MYRHIDSPGIYNPTMKSTVDRLRKEGIDFEIESPFHVTVGSTSFYPFSGVISRNGDTKVSTKSGLEAFVSLVR